MRRSLLLGIAWPILAAGWVSCSSIGLHSIAKVKPGEARAWRVETQDGEITVRNLHFTPIRVHLHTPGDEVEPISFSVEPGVEIDHPLAANQIFILENPGERPARIEFWVDSSEEIGAFQVRNVPRSR